MTPTDPDASRRVVAIGGGHGLARALGALRWLGISPTAVVTVADDGGSTGRLRRDLGIIAPGDLRMALLALARRTELAEVLSHRFTAGELAGHALGNLLLVALSERCGHVPQALRRAEALLDCDGRVLPSTTADVHLCAQVEGERIRGQARITQAHGRIERVWLEPHQPPAWPDALAALVDAEVVVIGPGSLYTSLIANFLVPGLADAAVHARRVLYVANLRAQPGETADLGLGEHLDVLCAHLDERPLDAALVHQGPNVGEGDLQRERPDRHPGVRAFVSADLAARDSSGRVLPAHDRQRLAEALRPLVMQ
ncbi:MAG: gluconeogenesis factor YvcK family protein [Egibacteraceae bacterium]